MEISATAPAIPGGIAAIPGGIAAGVDDLSELWQQLATADRSSGAAAYAVACTARRIIELTGMTAGAFAAEARARKIPGFGSQGAVSRRLRWAELHEALWERATLPRGVFIAEAATRPLFDGKLSQVERLKLLGELFADWMSDAERAELAAALSEARIRQHLGRDEPLTRRRSRLRPTATIRRLLAEGMSPGDICTMAHTIADSAGNDSDRNRVGS
jgi:hypothetical protein